jgi:uncharacterized protein (DUF58 family)
MTKSPLKCKANCGSGVPIFMLGVIAVGTGFYHSSALSAALGVPLVLLPLVVYALLRISLRGVRVTHVAPESAFEGDNMEVKIILHNGSRLPLFFPQVSEVFTPEMHAQKDTLFPYRVLPKETVEEVYRGDCLLPRGIYPLGPLEVHVSDPLGWFQARKRVRIQSLIKVYPRFRSFAASEKAGDCLSHLSDLFSRLRIGETSEFFSVREYRIGDPLRRVHWGLTAHRGYPVVRENTRQATGDLCLFLDLYRYALLGVGRGSSLELSVKIAASLSAYALERGHRVQLLAMGSMETRVPPCAGSGRLQPILDALASVRPDGTVPLDDFLSRHAHDIRPGSTAVLMVSSYLRESAKFEGELLSLRRSGIRVLLVIFDDATFRSLYEPPAGDRTTDEYASSMKALGMETVVVPCAGNLPMIFSPAAGGAP